MDSSIATRAPEWFGSASAFWFFSLSRINLSLQIDIQYERILSFEDKYTSDAILSWKSLSCAEIPLEPANHFQEVWDTVASMAIYDDTLLSCPGDAEQARLQAANSPNAGDWLNAPPIASVDLRLSDEEIRVAVGYWFLGPPSANLTSACVALLLMQEAFTAYHAESAHHSMWDIL